MPEVKKARTGALPEIPLELWDSILDHLGPKKLKSIPAVSPHLESLRQEKLSKTCQTFIASPEQLIEYTSKNDDSYINPYKLKHVCLGFTPDQELIEELQRINTIKTITLPAPIDTGKIEKAWWFLSQAKIHLQFDVKPFKAFKWQDNDFVELWAMAEENLSQELQQLMAKKLERTLGKYNFNLPKDKKFSDFPFFRTITSSMPNSIDPTHTNRDFSETMFASFAFNITLKCLHLNKRAPLSPIVLAELVEALKGNTTLSMLTLILNMDETGIESFTKYLADNTSLRDLRVRFKQAPFPSPSSDLIDIRKTNYLLFTESLRDNHSLTTLHLESYSPPIPEIERLFMDILNTHPSFTEVCLEECTLNSTISLFPSPLEIHHKLEHLFISNPGGYFINGENYQSFCEWIKAIRMLNFLHIAQAHLSNKCYEAIAKAAKDIPSITSLEIFSDDKVKGTAMGSRDLLSNNNELKHLMFGGYQLKLGEWSFDDDVMGKRALNKSPKQDISIENLCFSNCGLNNLVDPFLIPYLKRFSHLRILDLTFNELDDEAVITLSNYLLDHKTLETLDLESNEFGDLGAMALAKLLTFTATLKELNLLANEGIGERGNTSLIEAIDLNQSLTKLHYGAFVGLIEEGLNPLTVVLHKKTTPFYVNLGRILFIGNDDITIEEFRNLHYEKPNVFVEMHVCGRE